MDGAIPAVLDILDMSRLMSTLGALLGEEAGELKSYLEGLSPSVSLDVFSRIIGDLGVVLSEIYGVPLRLASRHDSIVPDDVGRYD